MILTPFPAPNEVRVSGERSLLASVLPALLAVAMIFLITGASLATLPLFLHTKLGFGADVVGAVAGAQFVSAVIARVWSGRTADHSGPKTAMLAGLALSLAAGGFYLAADLLKATPPLALAVLVVARVLLGGAESFIITASQSWGLALAGQNRAAAVIGWTGTALYVALAVGGPLGGALYAVTGFGGIAAMTLAIPVVTAALILPRPGPVPVPKTPGKGPSVLAAVARPGLAAGLAGFSYCAMAFFSVLLFLDRGWQPTWAPFSAFAVALVGMRLAFSGLPDRLSGRKTALVFLSVQMLGLAGLMQGVSEALALAASVLAGAGYAFIYPALGREAVRAVAPERVGRALGYYSACFDVSMGIAGLLLGQVADQVGLWAVFLLAVVASACAAAVVASAV